MNFLLEKQRIKEVNNEYPKSKEIMIINCLEIYIVKDT